MFTAIICILSQVAFVTPAVPFTLQTFAIALCGYTLSLKWSTACVVTYITVGFFGMPVFSAFRGGAQILLGPTGGFIWGFVILTISCSLTVMLKVRYLKVVLSGAGLILCHTAGVIQYAAVTQNGFFVSALTVSLPFILKDILSLITAYITAKYINTRIKGLKF